MVEGQHHRGPRAQASVRSPTGHFPGFGSQIRPGAARILNPWEDAGPMTGKNIWRLCKVYGRLIGCPTLKPHDLRHGVAMEVLEQHHDLEEVRALLGHSRIDTTQVYANIRPAQLKRAVAFYERKAIAMLTTAT